MCILNDLFQDEERDVLVGATMAYADCSRSGELKLFER